MVFSGGFGVDCSNCLSLVFSDDIVVTVLSHLVVDVSDEGQASFHFRRIIIS